VTNDELLEHYAEDFRALAKTPPITLTIPAIDAFCILGQIQLACRHPFNTGPSRTIAERFGHQLQHLVATTDALAEVARRGWDPAFDEEVT
jgi:hypothetical protein